MADAVIADGAQSRAPETQTDIPDPMRRRILAGMVALATAGVPEMAAAECRPSDTGPITALASAFSEAVQQATALEDEACRIEQAYEQEFGPKRALIPSFLGTGFCASLGREGVKESIARDFSAVRQHMRKLRMADATMGELAIDALEKREAENFVAVDDAFDRIESRPEHRAMASARAAADAAYLRRGEALLAVCRYRCATIEQVSIKAAALWAFMENDKLPVDAVDDLVLSFLPEGGAV